MNAGPRPEGRPVGIVTGGGGGIGAAVAERLGRDGWAVVTVDPLVSLDGSEHLAPSEDTTAGRIVAAGGVATASSASVTDADAMGELVAEVVERHGRVDGVVNVAGISRPTSFTRGSEDDWRRVVAVHLDGYLNVLAAVLPHMAAAGHGRVLGVTSGSGWRRADAGAYGCAKRAVAALTWQLGRVAPPGVVVNAMSPIAVTRMVTAALGRSGGAGADRGGGTTGGLSLGSMPEPDQLGPFATYLLGEGISWSSGRVFFAGGPEVAVVDEPRLLEVVRADPVAAPADAFEALSAAALAPAEAAQVSTGGSNPRLGPVVDRPPGADPPASVAATCLVVSDRPELARELGAALAARAVTCHTLDAATVPDGFEGAASTLAERLERHGTVDAVVVALAENRRATAGEGWQRILDEHAGLSGRLVADAAWVRAVADLRDRPDRPRRVVTLTDAVTAGGRSRAQAAAQLARSSRRATDDAVCASVVAVESAGTPGLAAAARLAAHLVCSPDAPALSGAELAVGDGWVGLRSHPRPSGSITLGGADLPPWFDGALRQVAGEAP